MKKTKKGKHLPFDPERVTAASSGNGSQRSTIEILNETSFGPVEITLQVNGKTVREWHYSPGLIRDLYKVGADNGLGGAGKGVAASLLKDAILTLTLDTTDKLQILETIRRACNSKPNEYMTKKRKIPT